jgi:hypothetical protein
MAVALAGCSGGGGEEPPALGLQATDSTGLIHGVVVDSAIRPLANVTVELVGDTPKTQRTEADGSFGFDGLLPGTYFLKATKLGYFSAQQGTEVVAGVADPPAVKIQLELDASFRAYYEAQVYDGFIECTSSAVVLCGIPNTFEPTMCAEFSVCYGNLTNDRFTFTQFFQANASHVQTELAWTSNQAASSELYLESEALTLGCKNTDLSTTLNGTRGASPIYVTFNESLLREYDIGPVCGIYFSVFSGDAAHAPCIPDNPAVGGACIPAGATVEQRFTAYTHAFYGYLPPPGWRFSTESSVPQPPQ